MSIYVQDSFQAMGLGPGVPLGWTNSFATLSEIRSFANGGAFFPHQWYALSAASSTPPNFGGTSPPSDITFWAAWSPFGIGTQGTMVSFNGPSNVGGSLPVATLVQENDATLSVYVAGSPALLVANTGLAGKAYWCQGISQNWYFLQVNLSISFTTILGINYLTITCDIAVDGQIIVSGASQVSNFVTDGSFPVHQTGFNQISLTGTAGWGELAVVDKETVIHYPNGIWTVALTAGGANYSIPDTTVVITDGGPGFGAIVNPVINPVTGVVTNLLLFAPGLNYTSPSLAIVDASGHGSGATGVVTLAPTPYRKVWQGAIETLQLPTTSNVRVHQGAIELIKHPTTSNALVYQAVIELLMQRTIVPGGTHVYEA